MRFKKIYLEISNICNLNCAFCPGTKRPKKRICEDEFISLMSKLKGWTEFLYFHLMGEPLCHPDLQKFLQLAQEFGFKVIITTNGTLLKKQQNILINAPELHKVNISLHAFEANDYHVPFDVYLSDCFAFGKAAEGKKIIVYRLWNKGGADERNNEILSKLREYFPQPWQELRNGVRIGQKVFLEYGDKFDWPDLTAEEGDPRIFCYGLRDQIGVLSDGTVVPCCLDHDGDLKLGNLFEEDLASILDGDRAKSIYQGFCNRKATEELCRKCGYARRFK